MFDIPHHLQNFANFQYKFININLIFYSTDSRKFGRSAFERSLIFKFETSAILKFYCSNFWPAPTFITINL